MSKKPKKRGPRGPYKKSAKRATKGVKKVELRFLNLNTVRTRRPGIKVANTCISMDPNTAKEMGFKPNSYVIVGESKDGKEKFLMLKPKNVAAGHVLRASKTGRLTAHIKKRDYKLTTGIFKPGTAVVTDIPTEQGDFTEAVAYPLTIE